jgi:membrane fusion protein, multidrug efflux system
VLGRRSLIPVNKGGAFPVETIFIQRKKAMSVTQRKRQPVLGWTCMVALGIAMVNGCGEPPEVPVVARPVKSMVLDSAASTVRRNYPGSVQASQRAEMAFKVSGPLIELPVQEGQGVEEGELLARIDPRDFSTRLADATSALSQAQATLRSMQQARPEDIRRLEARLTADNATLREASETLRRTQTLFKDRIVTQSDLDKAVAANDVAQANVDVSKENLDKGMAGAREEDIEAMAAQIEGLQAQVDAARHAHDDTFLKAPFKGVVARRLVENFEKVEVNQPIIWFQDLENVEIIINLPENVAATARRGRKAKMAAVFEALPETEFTVTLKEFSTEADPGTQTYKTTLTMPQPEEINVLPGMTCTVVHYENAAGGEDGSAFIVPVTAMYDEGGKQYA